MSLTERGLMVYTLNSEKRWNEALAYGVDGIVTDAPYELDDWIAETAPALRGSAYRGVRPPSSESTA